MPPYVLEWIGYIASLIVLISLLMSSIVKLRWINLVGAFLFGIYGFMIGSMPTALMNFGIVIIDVFYLVKIYLSKEYFKLQPIEKDNQYLSWFIEFYRADMNQFVPINTINIFKADVVLFVLRDMTPAALFVAKQENHNTLRIQLDYAIPQYRDMKLGKYLFETNSHYFTKRGYSKLIATSTEKKHTSYLQKMGFKKEGNIFVKEL